MKIGIFWERQWENMNNNQIEGFSPSLSAQWFRLLCALCVCVQKQISLIFDVLITPIRDLETGLSIKMLKDCLLWSQKYRKPKLEKFK